jgi:hypothetical protein
MTSASRRHFLVVAPRPAPNPCEGAVNLSAALRDEREREQRSPGLEPIQPREQLDLEGVSRALLVGGRLAQVAAHVADEIGSDAPFHEAPAPVPAREAVVVSTANDRLQR